MKQKLNAKDFILIGILTALMWIIGTVGLSGKTPSVAFRRSKTTGYHWSGNRKGQPRNLLRRAHQRLGL